jgi:hypothetical protein
METRLRNEELDRLADAYCAEKGLRLLKKAKCTTTPGVFYVAALDAPAKATRFAFFVDGATGTVRPISDAGIVMSYARRLGAHDLSDVAEYVVNHSLRELSDMVHELPEKPKRWWAYLLAVALSMVRQLKRNRLFCR